MIDEIEKKYTEMIWIGILTEIKKNMRKFN